MNNQERNREALIEHIAEQDRIIRRRNEQIANQAHNARESQRAIEELDARNNSLAADLADAVARADKAEKERDEARADLAEYVQAQALRTHPRPLAPDDITYEMVKRAQREEERQRGDWTAPTAMRHILTAALTEPSQRPEGSEEIERLLTENLGDFRPPVEPEAIADLLASRGVRAPEEMNR